MVGAEGEQLGEKSSREAYDIARNADLDLVCVAPTANPPVCKIMDYGKYRYEQQRKARESKKNQKVVSVKEIRMKPMIDKHDLETKVKRAIGFLQKEDKVKVTVRMFGRMMQHISIAEKVIDDFVEQCAEYADVEQRKRTEDGKQIFVVLAPKKA